MSKKKESKQYFLQKPLFFRGDKVWFTDHDQRARVGEVIHIETHYSTKHTGYHIYGILKPGCEWLVHIGESKILEIVE